MPPPTTTTVLQVIPFDNCKGCKDRVKKALQKHIGAGTIKKAPDSGKFTISAVKNPEVIKNALKQEFPWRTINLLPDENVPPPPPPTTKPSAPPMPASGGCVYGYPVGSFDPRYFR